MKNVMTAAVLTKFGGPEVLELHHDWPRPQPRDHQVLVKVTAAAVNNTDIRTRQGAYGLPEDPAAKAGWLAGWAPLIFLASRVGISPALSSR